MRGCRITNNKDGINTIYSCLVRNHNEDSYSDYVLSIDSNGYIIKEQIEDVKSGMSFEDRKGFVKLLKKVTNYEVKNVIVEHKDRLVRFGF